MSDHFWEIIFEKQGSNRGKTMFRCDVDHTMSRCPKTGLPFAAITLLCMLTLTCSVTAPSVENSKINNISLRSSAAFSLLTEQISLLAATLTDPGSKTNPFSTVNTVESQEKVSFQQWGLRCFSTRHFYEILPWNLLHYYQLRTTNLKEIQSEVCLFQPCR